MRLIVGLGNPGARYEANRHNIGFLAVAEIRRRYGFSPERARLLGQCSEGSVAGARVLALRPETFMNESGRAVRAALDFFKLAPEAIVVLQDEIDLPLGKVRAKKGGGAGGHNGLRSIDAHIGPDYWRVRLGVGHPGARALIKHHVLQDFAKEEWPAVAAILAAVAEALPLILAGDENRFMNKVNVLLGPPAAKSE